MIKVVLSRGPGSFGVNPYDCPESHIYANVIRFRGVPKEFYTKGVSLITSRIPVKKSFFATIKSCNYLPNVLMKMEAIDAGFQFAVALDEEGFLAEGPTENIGVLTEDNVMIFPRFERTLSGITANRVFQLAHILIEEKMIKAVKFDKVLPNDAYRAREIFLTGTSIDVLPVVIYDKKKIGKGIPGPVCSKLRELLQHDMTMNQDILTKVDL
jgi:branched-chain amino acid aminotransferase